MSGSGVVLRGAVVSSLGRAFETCEAESQSDSAVGAVVSSVCLGRVVSRAHFGEVVPSAHLGGVVSRVCLRLRLGVAVSSGYLGGVLSILHLGGVDSSVCLAADVSNECLGGVVSSIRF